ncbi:MAG: MBL fold metallo-hydrolase [Firmicutes bacterium]|nr:MBL fold metallo-hydrolase [Bacillota bacterium]
MIQEIIKNIYQIKIPLPGNPLRALNSYLIKGRGRSLLVDTGFNWPECKQAQLEAMAALKVNWSEIDFFITHVHGDHSGLVYALAQPDSRIYCSRIDADLMRASMTDAWWREVNTFFSQHGFPRQKIRNQAANMKDYISGSDLAFEYVEEGDVLAAGGYNLVSIATPGHSPGHLCLYEPHYKFLISGDHILSDITPNITPWLGVDDSLGQYLASLEKVYAMDIGLVLPGHRAIISDHRGRIDEIRIHHDSRLAEILTILANGPMNAYQVASKMHWDLTYTTWAEYPSFQKWFATGEAIAHLEHLTWQSRVRQILQETGLVYRLAP